MHLAAQYLAAAGISFTKAKEDDSHTNLGFDIETKSMETRVLSSEVDVLALNYRKFLLEWHSFKGKESLDLDGKTHKEVLHWLQEISQKKLNKEYSYTFHYDLPYNIEDTYTFQLNDINKLEHLCDLRILAEYTFETLTEKNNLDTEIRVWPHHYDTGGDAQLGDSGIAIGFGLATPDSVCNEHYFYIAGYKGENTINPEDFKKLSQGSWVSNGFTGAILPAASIIESEAIQFFQEVINTYKNIK